MPAPLRPLQKEKMEEMSTGVQEGLKDCKFELEQTVDGYNEQLRALNILRTQHRSVPQDATAGLTNSMRKCVVTVPVTSGGRCRTSESHQVFVAIAINVYAICTVVVTIVLIFLTIVCYMNTIVRNT